VRQSSGPNVTYPPEELGIPWTTSAPRNARPKRPTLAALQSKMEGAARTSRLPVAVDCARADRLMLELVIEARLRTCWFVRRGHGATRCAWRLCSS
jgi:hypothetical protein